MTELSPRLQAGYLVGAAIGAQAAALREARRRADATLNEQARRAPSRPKRNAGNRVDNPLSNL
jgi:hypothetical protein